MSSSRISARLLWAALVAAALAGCAVQPRVLTIDERRAAMAADRQALFREQEPVRGAITLEEAMARAVKYNLEHRVRLMEEAVAQRQLDLSRVELLPRLTLAAGYAGRDTELAASSRDITTGLQSLAPSTATDRERVLGDLGLSWNVLDFGVSYFQARQQADRALAAQERRRKALHLVMQQTRQAYWQAAGAQQLEARIEPVLQQARQALVDARQAESERVRSPLEPLNYQRQLLDIIRQLEAVRDELQLAKPRLASAMNLEPGLAFSVVPADALPVPRVTLRTARMEEVALLIRPELVESHYQERIGVLETRKALARLLPGVEISLGGHYDSNSYLVDNTWWDAGLRVSWNLLNALNAGRIRGLAQAQLDLARQQRLALGMAVLTQVHVAHLEYLARVRQHEMTRELHAVEQRILQHSRNAEQASAQGKLEQIRAAAAAMMSELRLYHSYGAVQGAYAQVIATLGLDPLPSSVDGHDIKTLTEAVRACERAWTETVDPGGSS
ncbi:TolC family protein [Piscinibacter sp. XHJ-5]|uniref:TolC family protein n=1 Tax=Piscinibacter sp. XHJ-5 TaxID=3037797 RepID=UPI00245362E6|nr:TolC family protein [Piscinibacter sp. XHJ-5]